MALLEQRAFLRCQGRRLSSSSSPRPDRVWVFCFIAATPRPPRIRRNMRKTARGTLRVRVCVRAFSLYLLPLFKTRGRVDGKFRSQSKAPLSRMRTQTRGCTQRGRERSASRAHTDGFGNNPSGALPPDTLCNVERTLQSAVAGTTALSGGAVVFLLRRHGDILPICRYVYEALQGIAGSFLLFSIAPSRPVPSPMWEPKKPIDHIKWQALCTLLRVRDWEESTEPRSTFALCK